MKNKKSLLGLGLFALILVLGVGYAVVSNVTLEFGGKATVGDADLKVDIASVVDEKTGSATVTHTLVAPTHAKKDTFTISGMSLNETVTMTYTIDSHETDVEATIAEKVTLTNDNETYFDAEYEITDANVGPTGGNATVVVTVTMIKTPVVAANGTANISFSIEAAPVNNAS